MQDESDAAGGQHGRGPLQLTALPGEDVEAIVDRQAENARGEIEDVRRWWLTELLTSPAPLRENLVLFLHGVFGCSTDAVDVPHALHGRNALLRRQCLGTVPDLLAALVVDPAMMIQIGMDEHRRLRVSDRPAKLVLTPAARLAVRYHLAAALAGRLPALGFQRPDSPTGEAAGMLTVPIETTLREASAATLLERLDPAPGLDTEAIEREVSGSGSPDGQSAFIRRVMMSPQYQLA